MISPGRAAILNLPRPLALLDKVCAAVNLAAEILVGVLVAAMTLDAFLQVVFRYGVEASLSWSEELARYLFVWVIFVGASVAVRRNQHIAMTALISALPVRPRRAFALAAITAFALFFTILAWVSLPLIDNARFTLSSELEIPIAWVYAAAPIGAILSVLHLFNRVLQAAWSEST